MTGSRLGGGRGGAFQGPREVGDGNSYALIEPAALIGSRDLDAPTVVTSRTVFHRQIAKQLAAPSQSGFAVLFMGLDDFRSVNESLGQAAADNLLSAVAENLLTTLSSTDTVARLEGEFAVLLADVKGPDEARQIAESLREHLRSPTRCSGVDITVRVSIGVRHCAASDESTSEELLSDAGAAMSRAVRDGRPVAVFEHSMRVRRLRRLQLTEALEHALDRGEISVHYQPYYFFTDGRACGVEALARWHHPVLGEVDPREFIELAEHTGRIQRLGLFILKQACSDLAQLRRHHPQHRDLTLSVNVSARQLADGRFQQELRTVLSETGLPGHALLLELTETAYIEDVHVVAERLADIRRTGVHLAVDDFGTRYASLSYLQRFPIDTLKVDKTFVQRLHESPYEHLLTGAIITLAKTLGLRTIAEGVEQDEHALRLSRLGCDVGQGFLFAHPVPVANLPTALSSGTKRILDNVERPRHSFSASEAS